MKNAITVIAILLLTSTVYAQNLGLKGGFLVSNISKTTAMFGGSAGLFLQTKGDVSFTAEANFKSINGAVKLPILNSNNVKTGEKKAAYSYYFLELPLMLGMRGNIKGEKGVFRPFINVGGSPAVLIGSRFNKKEFAAKDDFNLSVVVSPGVMMSDKVSIEVRVNKSIVGLDYASFSFLLGWRF